MRILTDCPEALASWPGGIAWNGAAGPSSVAERSLWNSIGGAAGWSGGRAANVAYWSILAARAEAAESQFDRLRRLVATSSGLPGPVACLALTGSRFHGQHDRDWVAAPGNLHLSLAFPAAIPARHAAALPMLAAVAVVDAIGRTSGGLLTPRIKWVNDVLVDGRKVAGILAASQVSGAVLTGVVLGIGINVASTPDVAPTAFVPSVTSLADHGVRIPLAVVLAAVLDAVARRVAELQVSGIDPIHDAYRQASAIIGREVYVFEDGPASTSSLLAHGTVEDIRPDLTLRLSGRAEPVMRGRLALAPAR